MRARARKIVIVVVILSVDLITARHHYLSGECDDDVRCGENRRDNLQSSSAGKK